MGGNKYDSKKITVDGCTFDSIDELRYYKYLQKLKDKGEILDFELNPTYELIRKFNKNGRTYEATTYTADFLIYYADGTEELIEVKGVSTKQEELRRKLFQFRFPNIKLTCIARSLIYSDEDQWTDYEDIHIKRKDSN